MDEFSGRGDQVPPELELELMDLSVRAAAVDEQATMDDPETHPKPPRAADEPVTDAAGDPVDVSDVTFTWGLWNRAYQDDPADAVLTGDDSGVEIVTDDRVDTTAGEWEVRFDPAATEGLYGEYYQRPEVEQSDGSTASWAGEVILTA